VADKRLRLLRWIKRPGAQAQEAVTEHRLSDRLAKGGGGRATEDIAKDEEDKNTAEFTSIR